MGVLVTLFFFSSFLFAQSWAQYSTCSCDDVNEDPLYQCVPFGHRVQLLNFDSALGQADYAVCSVYPNWGSDPVDCTINNGGNGYAISHFNFPYDPDPPCVQNPSWSLRGCSNSDNWDPDDINDPSVTSFDSCSSTVNCNAVTKDNSCSLGVSGVNMLKCDYGVTKGKCVTVRMSFPPGMVLGPTEGGMIVKASGDCEQGCVFGPSCENCETYMEDCGLNSNLNYGYSAAIGEDAYRSSCFPRITGFPGGYPGHGYDDAVSVFVGGNFNAERGAEVEGNVVVLGNLEVQANGAGNFVSVGAGSQVLPNNGGDCIIVGGDLTAHRNVQVFNLQNQMNCDIVYRGTGTNTNNWKTNGEIRHEPNYNLYQYERMKEIWAKKSQYWKNIPANGVAYEQYTTTYLNCDSTNDVQVFNIIKGDDTITKATSYLFNSDCQSKTILINVLGSGNIAVNAANMRDFEDNAGGSFSPCMAQNILWNFPDADNVDIGNGKTSEFYGSILVSGNLEFTTTGHSGRTIVLGDLRHFQWGSEFHSYQFKPPVELPCICVEEYCYEDGTCNPTCEDNVCAVEDCTPIEIDCADLITTNVTLPNSVYFETCDVNVTLFLREERKTVLIDHDDYGCEINVEDCEDGIYLGCIGPGSQEAGMYFVQNSENGVIDLTGSQMINECCPPGSPADDRSPPPPRACDYY